MLQDSGFAKASASGGHSNSGLGLGALALVLSALSEIQGTYFQDSVRRTPNPRTQPSFECATPKDTQS